MTKSTLLTYLFWGYEASMDAQEFADLKNNVLEHNKALKGKDAGELASSVLKNYPQFEIMHQSLMRSRIDRIKSDVSIIKTIVIIYFVCSIVAGIAFASTLL